MICQISKVLTLETPQLISSWEGSNYQHEKTFSTLEATFYGKDKNLSSAPKLDKLVSITISERVSSPSESGVSETQIQ